MNLEKIDIDIVVAELCESVFTASLKKQGVRFYELSGHQRKVHQNHKMFKQLLLERQYDVVHLNVFQGVSLYYGYLAKKAGVLVRIAHSHNTALRYSKTRWLKMILHNFSKRFLVKNFTDYWASSKLAAEFMFTEDVLKMQNYEFIPNGIDIHKFRFNKDVREKIRKKLDLENNLVIGNVGRLCYQKNQEFLLEVFVEIQKQKKNSILLLVGEGELRKKLQQMVISFGIEDKVVFCGVTNEVESLLWAMDIFVFPSRFEGLGIAVLEAQAAGLPVVCSDRVPSEVFTTENVQYISLLHGAKRWAECILKYQRDINREAINLQMHQTSFDVVDIAKNIENFYLGMRVCTMNQRYL